MYDDGSVVEGVQLAKPHQEAEQSGGALGRPVVVPARVMVLRHQTTPTIVRRRRRRVPVAPYFCRTRHRIVHVLSVQSHLTNRSITLTTHISHRKFFPISLGLNKTIFRAANTH